MNSRFDDTSFYFPLWLEARAALRLAEGDPEAALGDFRRSGRLRSESGFETPVLSWMPWRSGAALATARLGREDGAIELAEAELAIARRSAVSRTIGVSLRTLGLIRGSDEGIELLEEAVRTHEGSPSQLELARSLTELGAALRRSGRRRDSREPLRRGLALARSCGAIRVAARAEDELRASGARPRPATSGGFDALTVSEQRVARLAADGLTNRQIADELFLARKTVEHHLSRTYRKLGIESRNQLQEALRSRVQGQNRDAHVLR